MLGYGNCQSGFAIRQLANNAARRRRTCCNRHRWTTPGGEHRRILLRQGCSGANMQITPRVCAVVAGEHPGDRGGGTSRETKQFFWPVVNAGERRLNSNDRDVQRRSLQLYPSLGQRPVWRCWNVGNFPLRASNVTIGESGPCGQSVRATSHARSKWNGCGQSLVAFP